MVTGPRSCIGAMHRDSGVKLVSDGVVYGEVVDVSAAGTRAKPSLPELDAVAATL